MDFATCIVQNSHHRPHLPLDSASLHVDPVCHRMMQAFVPSVSLPCGNIVPHHHRRVIVCNLQPSRPHTWRVAPARLLGAVVGAIALVFTPVASMEALAKTKTTTTTSKDLRYDGRQELDGREKAMSLTLTGGTFAVLGVWAWKQNRRDDELENIRIKEEVERLEKLKAEFVDVEEDGDGLDDEDLMASLKMRIGEEDGEKTEGEKAEGEGEGGEGGEAEGEGGVAEGAEAEVAEAEVAEAEVAEAEVAEGEGGEGGGEEEEKGWKEGDNVTSDSVDMLKRMWEATDDTKDKKP